MPTAYKNARSFLAALAAMAEELRHALIAHDDFGRRGLLTQAMAESDMVFGVWPDEEEQRGFGVQIIKGEEILPPLAAFETDQEIVVAAIPCAGPAQALALRELCARAMAGCQADHARQTDEAA